MKKHAVSVQVTVVQIQDHEVEIEAPSKEEAALMSQLRTYDDTSFVKNRGERKVLEGPYKMNFCRELVELEDNEVADEE